MCRSDQYCPCSTWCTSAPGRPLDYQVCCAMMMIAYRPMDTTLAQVRNLFWGWHLLPAALKWRYFSTMPDFGSTLTQLQAAACKPCYDHMYEGPIMKAVVIELRKYMVTCNIKHDDYNVVDGIFVRLFHAVYTCVTNAGQPLSPCNGSPSCTGSAQSSPCRARAWHDKGNSAQSQYMMGFHCKGSMAAQRW
ncbi:hypothetical protein COO60DRAFT_1628225 [Scenedesmus sp. NREL 46B-D3]|nr:hypothetical protein COO60DRAFT_1628225 [Scenedesmus sp. NREL 46B-D3]